MVSLLATTTVVAIESNIQVSFCGNFDPEIFWAQHYRLTRTLSLAGSKDDILSISELSFEPEYVQPGDVVTIYGSGALSRDISPGSKIEATFKCNGTEYYNTTYDYCSFVEKKEIDGDLKCPVSQGSLEVSCI